MLPLAGLKLILIFICVLNARKETFVYFLDIDECARGLDDCRSDEECLNNEGSFTCRRESVQVPTCRVGYVYDPQRGGCIPQRSSAECRPGFAFNTVSERCEGTLCMIICDVNCENQACLGHDVTV